MAELFNDGRNPELLEAGDFRRDQTKDRAVSIGLLQKIAAEARPLIHLVREIEIAAFFENLPASRSAHLAQHPGRFLALHRFVTNRPHVSVFPHLRRLTFADVQIGTALRDDDGEELIDVGHVSLQDALASAVFVPPGRRLPRR